MRISLLVSFALFTAVTAFGGVVYDYQTVVSSPAAQTLSGTVTLDGSNVRMSVARGDGTLLKDGAIILSSDGGATQLVLDPAAKTYYELSTNDLLEFMKRLPMKPEFGTPEVTTHKEGDGGLIEGMPTQKVRMEVSTSMTMKGMGQDLSMPVRMTFESWVTDRLPITARPPFMGGVRTGIDFIDKMVEASPEFASGFPLKSVMTQRFKIAGQETVTTITYTASNVRQPDVDKTLFALPAEYQKVESPLEGFFKEIGLQ